MKWWKIAQSSSNQESVCCNVLSLFIENHSIQSHHTHPTFLREGVSRSSPGIVPVAAESAFGSLSSYKNQICCCEAVIAVREGSCFSVSARTVKSWNGTELQNFVFTEMPCI